MMWAKQEGYYTSDLREPVAGIRGGDNYGFIAF
jgi:hypothetical protein